MNLNDTQLQPQQAAVATAAPVATAVTAAAAVAPPRGVFVYSVVTTENITECRTCGQPFQRQLQAYEAAGRGEATA